MYTILNLFGKSPFAPLQSHMELVNACVTLLPELFVALEKKDRAALETIAQKISAFEHDADLTKNDIRNHLPKSLYLPVDRSNLLDILSIQDSIADNAEDVAVLLTLAPLELSPELRTEFFDFLKANIASYEQVRKITKEMHELLESSFGGNEAEKVKGMVDQVATKEHEVDLLQRKLLIKFFGKGEEMSQVSFHLWQKVFEAVGAISNLAEKLANRIRTMLELK
jgi:predicted phosphate transport protein (TIGR00153 family)